MMYTKMFRNAFVIFMLTSSLGICSSVVDEIIEKLDLSVICRPTQPIVKTSPYIENLNENEKEYLVYGFLRRFPVDIQIDPFADIATEYIQTEKMFQMLLHPNPDANVKNNSYKAFRQSTLRKFVKSMNDATLDVFVGKATYKSLIHSVNGSMDKDGNAKINFYSQPSNAVTIPESSTIQLDVQIVGYPDIELREGVFSWFGGFFFDVGLVVPGHKNTLKLDSFFLGIPYGEIKEKSWMFEFTSV
eukprot:188522_1